MFSSFVKRGFFFKSLVTVVLLFYLNFVSIKPAYAISTVDGCSRQPSCAKAFLGATGARTVLATKKANLVTKTINVDTINLSKGNKLTTALRSFGTKSILFGFGSYLAEKVFGSLISSGVSSVQEKIKDYYCKNHTSDNCDRPGALITGDHALNSYTVVDQRFFSPKNVQYEKINYSYEDKPYTDNDWTNNNPETDYYYLLKEDDLIGGGGTGYSFTSKPTIEPYILPGIAWDEWSTADKFEAIDEYFEDKPKESFDDLIDSNKPSIPDYEPGDTINFNTHFHFDGSDILDGGEKYEVPDDEPDALEDEDDQDPGFEETKELPPDDEDSSDPPPEDEEEEEEQEEEEEEEEVDLCPPDQVESLGCEVELLDQNFLEFAVDKFIQDPRFPFDIFGDLPTSNDNKCPSLEMFDHKKELCFINETFSKLKYPAWILWIYKLVFSL